MKTSDFNYYLPEELIAQTPLTDRTASRPLVLDKNTGEVEHRHFLRYLTVLLASGCVGGAVYLLVCGIFRSPELVELLSPLLRRVKKA